jgi:hypothetical protein
MMLGCDTAVRRSQSPSHSTAALRLVAPPSRQQLDTLYWKIRAHEHKIMGPCCIIMLRPDVRQQFRQPSYLRLRGNARQISIILLIMRVRFLHPAVSVSFVFYLLSSCSQRLLGCSVLVLGNLHGFTPFTLLVYLFCIERSGFRSIASSAGIVIFPRQHTIAERAKP